LDLFHVTTFCLEEIKRVSLVNSLEMHVGLIFQLIDSFLNSRSQGLYFIIDVFRVTDLHNIAMILLPMTTLDRLIAI